MGKGPYKRQLLENPRLTPHLIYILNHSQINKEYLQENVPKLPYRTLYICVVVPALKDRKNPKKHEEKEPKNNKKEYTRSGSDVKFLELKKRKPLTYAVDYNALFFNGLKSRAKKLFIELDPDLFAGSEIKRLREIIQGRRGFHSDSFAFEIDKILKKEIHDMKKLIVSTKQKLKSQKSREASSQYIVEEQLRKYGLPKRIFSVLRPLAFFEQIASYYRTDSMVPDNVIKVFKAWIEQANVKKSSFSEIMENFMVAYARVIEKNPEDANNYFRNMCVLSEVGLTIREGYKYTVRYPLNELQINCIDFLKKWQDSAIVKRDQLTHVRLFNHFIENPGKNFDYYYGSVEERYKNLLKPNKYEKDLNKLMREISGILIKRRRPKTGINIKC